MKVIEETDDRFYIDKSTLPNGGLGVFANSLIRKGDCLEVIGAMVQKNSITAQCTHYADNYKFAAAKKNATRDIIPVGYAAIVNHAIDQKYINMVMMYRVGPKKSNHASNLVLMASRDIYPGEECLHFYGDHWNDSLKWKQEASKIVDEQEEEWDKFISLGLYNLDFLQHLSGEKSC